MVKNSPANAGDKRCGFDPWVRKIPWRESMATLSSIFAWRTPWTEEPGGLQFIGSHRVRHDRSDLERTHTNAKVAQETSPSDEGVGVVERKRKALPAREGQPKASR